MDFLLGILATITAMGSVVYVIIGAVQIILLGFIFYFLRAIRQDALMEERHKRLKDDERFLLAKDALRISKINGNWLLILGTPVGLIFFYQVIVNDYFNFSQYYHNNSLVENGLEGIIVNLIVIYVVMTFGEYFFKYIIIRYFEKRYKLTSTSGIEMVAYVIFSNGLKRFDFDNKNKEKIAAMEFGNEQDVLTD